MDEMKVKISTKFMKSLVAKLMAKFIYKKFGYKVNIQLDDFDVSIIDGETSVKANVEVKLNNSEFMKLMKSINED